MGSERNTKRGKMWAVALLMLCVASALLAVFYPAYVIQPFRAQGSEELLLALKVIRFAPLTTLVTAIVGLIAVIVLRPQGWLKRTFAVLAVIVLVGSAALARVDYFEWMFHPNPHPRFVSLAEAAIEPGDMVLVARSGEEAHAYPVRFMAYHHLVNDVVGGVPIVATY